MLEVVKSNFLDRHVRSFLFHALFPQNQQQWLKINDRNLAIQIGCFDVAPASIDHGPPRFRFPTAKARFDPFNGGSNDPLH